MNCLNNRGFTLIEVLAVIAIIALLGVIAVPNILSTINTSKNVSEQSMISNIKSAAENLYLEVEFSGNVDNNGDVVSDLMDRGNYIKINNSDHSITISLQGLVSNGFLSGTGDDGHKKIINSKTGDDIGNCIIKITKVVLDDDESSYEIKSVDSQSKCPSHY